MPSPKVLLRWVIAVPCAFVAGVAIAFGSWHFRDGDFLKHFQRGSTANEVSSTPETKTQAGHAASSTAALPSLTQDAVVAQERQPSKEHLAVILEQEKQRAANEALTSYILSQEVLPKLSQTAGERPPDHPLVEELINKPNAMRGSVLASGFIPEVLGGNDASSLGGYSQDVLREAFQAFNSPANASLRADAKAAADMTLNQVSALRDLQEEVRSRLEQGRGGALGNVLGLGNGSGLGLSSGARQAVGNMVANALGGSGYSYGYGSGGGASIMSDDNYMTPPVGSPTVPVVELDSSQLAAAAALVTEYRRLLPGLSEAEMKEYLYRVETEGKIAAMQWVVRTKSGR